MCVFQSAFFFAQISVKKFLERKAGEKTKNYSIFNFENPVKSRVFRRTKLPDVAKISSQSRYDHFDTAPYIQIHFCEMNAYTVLMELLWNFRCTDAAVTGVPNRINALLFYQMFCILSICVCCLFRIGVSITDFIGNERNCSGSEIFSLSCKVPNRQSISDM